MKVVKLTKKMFDLYPDVLLVKLKASYKDIGYPQHVYFSNEDYKKYKKNIKEKDLKRTKIRGWISDYAMEMDFLNFGPNTTLGNAIRPGYALVDEYAINLDIVTRKLTAV